MASGTSGAVPTIAAIISLVNDARIAIGKKPVGQSEATLEWRTDQHYLQVSSIRLYVFLSSTSPKANVYDVDLFPHFCRCIQRCHFWNQSRLQGLSVQFSLFFSISIYLTCLHSAGRSYRRFYSVRLLPDFRRSFHHADVWIFN